MGCCVQNMAINSSSIPLSPQESFENENNFQNNFNIVPNIIVVKKPKTKSNKTSEHIVQKGRNKVDRKNIKSMNVLKELSYDEVCECTKYF